MNKNNYNPPSLDDLQSDYRVKFSDYEIFDVKKFSKEINLISKNFQKSTSAAISKTQDEEGKKALEEMVRIAENKKKDVKKMLVEAQNKARAAGMELIVRFDNNRSEMMISFVDKTVGTGLKDNNKINLPNKPFSVVLDVGSAKRGYTNGVPARKSPSMHFTAKDPNNIGAYFTSYTEDVLTGIISVLDEEKRNQSKTGKKTSLKEYYKKWEDMMDDVVQSVIGTSGHASAKQKEAFKDEYNYGADSRRRENNFLGTNVKMAGFLREIAKDIKTALKIDRDDITDDQFQKDLMMYIALYQKKHLGKEIADNYLKNMGYKTDKKGRTEVGKLMEKWLGNNLLKLTNTIGFGSENVLTSQTMSFAGGDEYWGYANSPDDTRALQQYQNSRKRYKKIDNSGSFYKRGKQRHFVNKDDDMSIATSAEELTYNIALLRRNRFYEAYENAKQIAANSIKENISKQISKDKNANYESLTNEQKKIVDSKVIQILKKQGYFDLVPELREDMGYATASAMKEWTSSSTRTKIIDQDAFKKWENKAKEKLIKKNNKRKNNENTFRFGRNTYSWDDNGQKQFIKDYISTMALKINPSDLIGNSDITITYNDKNEEAYDIRAESFMGKEFLNTNKIGGEVKTITRGGLRGYDERMSDATMKGVLKQYFYRELLEQDIVSDIKDDEARNSKYDELNDKNLAEIEELYREHNKDKAGFSWEKAKKDLLNTALKRAKQIDKIREHEGIKLQQSWSMITGLIEKEYDSLDKSQRKKFLDKLKKIDYFKKTIKSQNGTDIVKFSNIAAGSEEDNFDINQIYKELKNLGIISSQSSKNLDDVITGRASMVYRDAVAIGDVYDWNRNVSYGPKERAGIERTIAASGSGSDYAEAIQKRILGGEGNLKKEVDAARSEIEEIDKVIDTNKGLNVSSYNLSRAAIDDIIENSYSDADGKDNKGLKHITIGYGDKYSIDISDMVPEEMEYVRGHLPEEEYSKTIWYKIDKAKEKLIEAQGFTTEKEKEAFKKQIQIAIDPMSNYAFKHQYSKDDDNPMVSGTLAYLPNVDPLKQYDKISEKMVYSLPDYNSETKSLLWDIKNAAKHGQDDNYSEKISNDVKDLSVKMFDATHTNKGSIMQRAYKVRSGMSKSFQTSPVSVEQILDMQSQGLDAGKYIHGAFASPEAIEDILSDTTDYKDKFGVLSKDAERKYLLDLFTDLKADDSNLTTLEDFLSKNNVKSGDFKNSQKALINALINNPNGIRVLSNRFPSLEQEPIRNIRLYADDSIKSKKIIKLGAGLATSQKDDYDGDMHNIRAKMLGDLKAYQQDKTEAYDAEIIDEVFNMTYKGPDSDYYYNKEKGKWVLKHSDKTPDKEFGNANLKFSKELAEVTSRLNKTQVGVNSNYATALRNFFDKQARYSQRNIRDDNGNINVDSLENIARSTILLSAMQTLEQDAISSKKIRDRIKTIIKEKTNNTGRKLTKEEKQSVANQVLGEYNDLNEMISTGKLGNQVVSDEDVIKKMTQMGIIGEDGTKSLASRVSVAQIKKWAKDAFGNNKDKQEQFYKNIFGNDYQKVLSSGAITQDQYLAVLKTLSSDQKLKRDGRNFFVKEQGEYGKASIIKATENRSGMDGGDYYYNKYYANIKNGKVKNKDVYSITHKVGSSRDVKIKPEEDINNKLISIPGESVTKAIGRAFDGEEFPDLTGFYEQVDNVGNYGGKKLTEMYGDSQFKSFSKAAYATKFGDVVHAAKEAYIDFITTFGKVQEATDISSMIKWLNEKKDSDEKAKKMLDDWSKKSDKNDHTKKAGIIGAYKELDDFVKSTSLSENQYNNRVKHLQENTYELGAQIGKSSLKKITDDKGNIKDGNFIINEGAVAGQYEGHAIGGQYDTVLGIKGEGNDPFTLLTQDIKTRGNTNLKGKDLIQPLIYAYYQKQAHDYLQRDDIQKKMSGMSLEDQKKLFYKDNKAWALNNKEIDDKMFKALLDNKNVNFLADVQYANRKTGEYATYRADLNTILNDRRGNDILSKIIGKGGILSEDDQSYLQKIGVQKTSIEESGKVNSFIAKAGYEFELETMREINKLLNERAKIETTIENLKNKQKSATTEEEINALQKLIDTQERYKANITDEIDNKTSILSDDDKKNLEVLKKMGLGPDGKPLGNTFGGDNANGKKGLFDNFGKQFKGYIVNMFSAYRIISKITQRLRNCVQIAKELDKAATNIRIVTGMSSEEVDILTRKYTGLARELGVTTQVVAQSGQEWMRQGYSAEQANNLIISSTKLSKLGMMDMNNATKVLTSTMKGFKLEASNVGQVVDKLTKLDMNYATTAADIGEAMSRTAAIANQMGVSLDETAAMVTTIMDITQQSAEMTGTAIRTILSRYGNVKSGSFVSMLTDGEDLDKINDIEKVLSVLGIEIRKSGLEMRDVGDVLDQLALKWTTLSDVEKNAVATAFAGTRQRNQFIVLMDNWKQVEEATDMAANAAGTADDKYGAYMDSIEARLNKLQAAWEEFTQKVGTSSFVKGAVNALTFLVENLDKMLTSLVNISAYLMARKLWANVGKLGGIFNGLRTIGFKKGAADAAANPNGGILSRIFGTTQKGFTTVSSKLDQIMAIMNGKQTGDAAMSIVDSMPASKRYDLYQKNQATITANEDKIKTLRNKIKTAKDNIDKQKYPNSIFEPTDKRVIKTSQASIDNKIAVNNSLKAENTALKGKGFDVGNGKIITMRKGSDGNIMYYATTMKGDTPITEEIDSNSADAQNALAQKKARAKQKLVGAGAMGLASGVMAYMSGTNSYFGNMIGGENIKINDIKSDTKDNIVNGVATGAATGFLSAIPGIGPILGPMLGPVLGDLLGSWWKQWNHRDEIARKERVEEAKKNLEALNKLQSTIESAENSIFDMSTPESVSKAKNDVDAIIDALLESDNREKILSRLNKTVEEIESTLLTGTEEEKREILSVINSENNSSSVIETFRAQEQDRYDAYKKYNDLASKEITINNSYIKGMLEETGYYKDMVAHTQSGGGYSTTYYTTSLSGSTSADQAKNASEIIKELNKKANSNDVPKAEKEFLDDEIKRLQGIVDAHNDYQAEILKMNKEVNKLEIKNAFSKSGFDKWTSLDVSFASIEEVVQTFANNLELTGAAVRDSTGEITNYARTQIETFLRSNERFSSLFSSSGKTLNQIMSGLNKQSELLKETGARTFEELKNAFDTQNKDSISKYVDNFRNSFKDSTGKFTKTVEEASNELMRLVYKYDDSQIEGIARALNMTTDDLLKMRKLLGGVKLSDLILSPEETRSSFNELNNIFSELSTSGTVTGENLEKLNTKYFSLYNNYDENGDVISTSFNNVLENLRKRLFGDQNTVGTQGFLYQNATFQTLKEDSGLYDSFYYKVKNNLDLYNLFDENQRKLLESANSLTDIMHLFNDETFGGEMQNILIEILNDMKMNNDYYKEIQDKLIEWQKHENDTVIDNLKSQIDALNDINKEREKEIALIKAKDALENAKKEKVRVYRAGVGWTYEANQQKVSDAKEDLEKLERENNAENLQYQIDLLEQQNSMLDNISKNEELKGLKNSVDSYVSYMRSAFGKDIGSNITSLLDNSNYIMKWDEYVQMMGKQAKASVLDEQSNILKNVNAIKKIDAEMAAEKNKNSSKYIGLQEERNKAVESIQESKQKLSNWDVGSDDLKNYLTSEGVDERYTNIDNGGIYSAQTLNERYYTVPERNKEGETLKDEHGNNKEITLKATELYSNDEISKALQALESGDDKLTVVPLLKNGQWGDRITNTRQLDSLENGSIVHFGADKSSKKNDVNAYAIKDGISWRKLVTPEPKKYGTLGLNSDILALINEVGTEGIVTPQGTITALPSKTGIIPADLTENLYRLGEVAPNLIKNGSFDNKLVPISTNSKEDNSMNIDNFYATFETDDGFDFEKLLISARQYIKNTKKI